MAEQARFRPPRGGLFFLGAFTTVVLYFVLNAVGLTEGSLPAEYPFGVALVVGVAFASASALSSNGRRALVVDEDGIESADRSVRIPWREVDEVRVEELTVAGQKVPTRVASVHLGAERIRFSDGNVGLAYADVVPVDNAGLLLGLVAHRTGSTALQPPTWSEDHGPVELEPPPSAARRVGVGLAALIIKAGPKALKMGMKLLKTIKPGAAVVAVGAYSLIFSWKFALALVVHVLVHECGHVFAMFRSGVAVRGIYLIPFFGGAAVSRGVAKTRWNSAYIALNGPVWGMLLSGALAAAHVGLDGRYPILGAMAGWGALINLFNLLPILPLDGGRVLSSLAASSERGLGVPITVASLLFGAGVAYLAELELLVLMVLVGLTELGSTLAARPVGPSLALLEGRPMGREEISHFARLLLPPAQKGREAQVKARAVAFESRRQEALQDTMTRTQALKILFGYVAVTAVLVAVLYAMTAVQGAGDPMSFLR